VEPTVVEKENDAGLTTSDGSGGAVTVRVTGRLSGLLDAPATAIAIEPE
jgi:hypothetical protein